MRKICVLLWFVVLVSACGGGDSSSTPTSPSATPTTFTLSGTVRDSQGDATLGDVNIHVVDGPNANRSVRTGQDGSYALADLQGSGFTIRLTKSGYDTATRSVTLTQNTRLDTTLARTVTATIPSPPPPTCTTPGTPSNLNASVSGSTVTFSWSAASGSDYLLGIGTSLGSSNTDTKTASGTSFTWTSAPSGTYYARVRARNSCGAGTASNEVTFTVGSAGGGGSTPPSSWSGPLPSRSSGSHPVCQATLPSVAACVNDLTGPPQAICSDSVYSCSTGSGTCSSHGGVYCWRN